MARSFIRARRLFNRHANRVAVRALAHLSFGNVSVWIPTGLTPASHLVLHPDMLDAMNGDTMINAEQCALDAGALVVCPMCDQLISANDEEAERMAYAVITNAWKDGVRGFRNMERSEVMDLMKRVLQRSSYCSCSVITFDL